MITLVRINYLRLVYRNGLKEEEKDAHLDVNMGRGKVVRRERVCMYI